MKRLAQISAAIRKHPVRWGLGAGLCILLILVIIAATNPMACFRWGATRYLNLYGIERKKLKAGSFRISYLEGGAENAETVVLLHGFGGDGLTAWLRTLPLLQKHYHVIAPDLLCGSPKKINITNYSATREFQLVMALLREKKIDKAHFVGLSVGGWIALMTASVQPGMVDRLVLISTAGVETDMTELMEVAFSETSSPAKQVDLFFFHKPPFAEAAFGDHSPEGRLLRNKIKLVAQVMMERGPKMDGVLDDIVHPTLILWGRDDRVFPVETAEYIHDRMPNSKLRIFDECGHAVVWDRGNAMNAAILEFLGAD
ncbi:MAG: alpha/beta fold hydrolase [Candidatus Sumerlaeia bacterium]